ncbi:MAG: hypothetical protein Edafosvirus7_42, partial [Edafosvirus sp.]
MTKSPRKVSDATKKVVVASQDFKCNNKPGKNLYRLNNFLCPRWKYDNGNFSEVGNQGDYIIKLDYIIERSIGGSDDIENLQVLCPDCYSVKTNNFMKLSKDEKKKLKEGNKIKALEEE